MIGVGAQVFLSYSRTDRSYVDELALGLRTAGISVWYDISLSAGDRFADVIERSIGDCVAFVVVLTPESVGSEWVRDEIAYATHRKKPVIPVQLRPSEDIPLQLISLNFEVVVPGQPVPTGLITRLRLLLPTDTAAGTLPAAGDRATELPHSVCLFNAGDVLLEATPDAVLDQWLANGSIVSGPLAKAPPQRAGSLRAVVGRTATGPHSLDLNADGPHAFVAGTTGSGKSEFLLSWVVAMAAAHSPQRLTFLLFDYKGGSAFRDVVSLPHTVGMITELDQHQGRRTVNSLFAELTRRERFCAAHGVPSFLALEQKGVVDAPPRLVIIVDEFASIIRELPDFVDGIKRVAMLGRSLGVHLVVATQRPELVLGSSGSLGVHMNLRVALRCADDADSASVLGSPLAAHFAPGIPGRAASRSGPDLPVQFQTAYVGGWSLLPELFRPGDTVRHGRVHPGPTDVQRIVAAISQAAEMVALPRPALPMLPALRPTYDLATVVTSRQDHELVFGVLDQPEQQAQPPAVYWPDAQGNLAIFGANGAGKTVLLRTLAVAAGFSVRSGPCFVYGVDFGDGGLSMIEDLPHVGAVVPAGDPELLARLLRMLSQMVVERDDRFSRVGTGTLSDYRRLTGMQEPRVLLILDGLVKFRQAHESDGSGLFGAFCRLAMEGRPLGVHVIVTAEQPSALPGRLAAVIGARVVLRLADAGAYLDLGVPPDVLQPTSPPGRGMVDGSELQVAILGNRTDLHGQAAALREFSEAQRRAEVQLAPPVLKMPERVLLSDLPTSVGGLPVLGLDAASLSPVPFDPKGAFVIAGPARSGRSSAIRTVVVALCRAVPEVRTHVFTAARFSHVGGPGLWTTQNLGVEASEAQAKALLESSLTAPTVLVMEGIADLAGTVAENALAELINVAVTAGAFVVAEGEASILGAYSPLLQAVKQSRYGLCFAPDPVDGDRIFHTPFPVSLSRAEFRPGRALFVRDGHATTVGVAWVDHAT